MGIQTRKIFLLYHAITIHFLETLVSVHVQRRRQAGWLYLLQTLSTNSWAKRLKLRFTEKGVEGKKENANKSKVSGLVFPKNFEVKRTFHRGKGYDRRIVNSTVNKI